MTGVARAAMQISFFGGPISLLASRRTRYVADTRGERREDWIEMFHHVCLAANHHAVASFQPPHTAARANIDIMNVFPLQFLCATAVVNVIRLPDVNEDFL